MSNNNSHTGGYRVEVKTYDDGNWSGNALTFRSEAGARAYASDLAGRWTLVIDWRVITVAVTPPAIGDSTTVDWAEEAGAARPHADAPAWRVTQ